MKILKSKVLIGLVCFVLGVAAALLIQKLNSKPAITFLASNPPHALKNMDSIFDQFYDDDFFGRSGDPFENMRKMRKQMLQQFDQPEEGGGIFDSWYRKKFGGGDAGEVKKREDKNFIYYDFAIKDLDKEKLKVKVEDGQISISGQTEKKFEENGSGSYYSSSFHRSFPAPPEVDADKFQMEQLKDTLTLKFPKRVGV